MACIKFPFGTLVSPRGHVLAFMLAYIGMYFEDCSGCSGFWSLGRLTRQLVCPVTSWLSPYFLISNVNNMKVQISSTLPLPPWPWAPGWLGSRPESPVQSVLTVSWLPSWWVRSAISSQDLTWPRIVRKLNFPKWNSLEFELNLMYKTFLSFLLFS